MHLSYGSRLLNQADLSKLQDGLDLKRFEGLEVKDRELYNFVMKKLGREVKDGS